MSCEPCLLWIGVLALEEDADFLGSMGGEVTSREVTETLECKNEVSRGDTYWVLIYVPFVLQVKVQERELMFVEVSDVPEDVGQGMERQVGEVSLAG